MKLINTTLETLKIKDYFKVIHSAEDEVAGKPDPAVFLTSANKLKINPENCLVLEDSKAGMMAGLAAKIRTVVIPEKGSHPKWAKKSFKILESLKDFKLNLLN